MRAFAVAARLRFLEQRNTAAIFWQSLCGRFARGQVWPISLFRADLQGIPEKDQGNAGFGPEEGAEIIEEIG